jgi:ribosomal protein S18 acetylase RimI-like enzyme
VGGAPTAEGLGLRARAPTGADFRVARRVVEGWFGRPVGLVMHRLFFEELGPSGVWLEGAEGPAGFLLGLRSESDPALAYAHFFAVDPAWRRRGVGRLLYTLFGERMAARGCERVRSLAAPTNGRSLRFHESLGFTGRFSAEHVGPGQDRVVFERSIPF